MALPHRLTLREYQTADLWEPLFELDFKRIVGVWHRRSGKDKTGFNALVRYAATRRVGNYFYVFPTYRQGRRALWNAIDADGLRTLDHIPPELIESSNDQEMFLRLVNGSTIQILGAAAEGQGRGIDAIVGSNPVGIIYSEYSLMPQRAWDLLRPVLAENGGWAVFLFTPRGDNHAYDLYQMALSDPDWYCSLLTVDDTTRADGSPVVPPEQIEADRRSGMPEELIQQEYYCSFASAMTGSYYARLLEQAEKEGRIRDFIPIEDVPAYAAWDLGIDDSTAIWIWQQVGMERRFIDYYETFGQDLGHYARWVQERGRERGYSVHTHYLPHDGGARELQTGKSRQEFLVEQRIGHIVTTPRLPVDQGIQASRTALRSSWFDKTHCQDGIKALRNYRVEYDEDKRVFGTRPVHDWSSHAADAYRTHAVGFTSGEGAPFVLPSADYVPPYLQRRRA